MCGLNIFTANGLFCTLGRSSLNRFVTENSSDRLPICPISSVVVPLCILGRWCSRTDAGEMAEGGWTVRGECGGESTSNSEELERDREWRSSCGDLLLEREIL